MAEHMNKGLDLIQRVDLEFIDGFPTGNLYVGVTEEEYEELEKELKALEIIKEKKVDVAYIIEHPEVENVFWYNSSFTGVLCEGWRMLSKEEWTLLKEVFK